MPKDVLITPLSSRIELKDTNSNIDGLIQLDASDNLSITSPNGTLNLGNAASNVVIGDGTNSVDVIFEQNGSIRGLTGKTVTLGQSDSFINFASRTTAFKGGTAEIKLRTLDDGTLSFEGGSGQLFSITDSLSGTIFSVNDISGIPSIEVLDDGTVKLAEYGGTVTLPSTTSIGNISSTEIGYLDGVTSAIQTQLDGKEKTIPLQNTPPSSPSTSDLWVDNTDPLKPVLKVYNGSSWVTAGSSITADDDQIILASRVFS